MEIRGVFMNSQIKKETGSHYTSEMLSQYMSEKLLHYFKKMNQKTLNELKILDPSCGEGSLLKSVAKSFSDYNVKLIGMDTNQQAVNMAAEELNLFSNKQLIQGDYLASGMGNVDLFSNFEDLKIDEVEPVDLIIANPPYVRTQVLGADKAQELGKRFGLKGRVDLYHAFLVAMTEQLKEDGIICVITSNRYLTTAGGKDVRKYLNDNYEILEIIDLGDTKMFEAAVLPAIFIGKKRANNNNKVKFLRIYESQGNTEYKQKNESIFDVLKMDLTGTFYVEEKNKTYDVISGYLSIPEDAKDLWAMASKDYVKWAQNLRDNASCEFLDIFNIRVGIKSTADTVFIRTAQEWDKLDEEIYPEQELLKPLISSDNISKWQSDSSLVEKKLILYTHTIKNGKRAVIDTNDFPKANNYFNYHKSVLAGRAYLTKSKTRKWYEIWVPQDPVEFNKLKVVFPDISLYPRFSVDKNKHLVDGNCYWLTAKKYENQDLLYLACAVGNSKIMQKYHEIEFQNVLYAGRKRYLTQYVKHYLLPEFNSIESKKIIDIVKDILNNSYDETQLVEKENEIEVLLAYAFKIKDFNTYETNSTMLVQ